MSLTKDPKGPCPHMGASVLRHCAVHMMYLPSKLKSLGKKKKNPTKIAMKYQHQEKGKIAEVTYGKTNL